MSSSVFYRFKSQKEPSRVIFDGTGISVFELKREIITQCRLGDGTDFELVVSSEDTNEEYSDDTSIIQRSTTVIAKRLPATRAGRGGAARYVSGKMPQSARSFHKQDMITTRIAAAGPSHGVTAMHGAHNEDEKIAAMLQMGADDWVQQQQHMASAAPIHRAGPMKSKPHNIPDRPLPPGYVCNRCGEKGHWIWDCPTNNDPAFDGRPRIKRTTGIPKSFLKTIEKPALLVNDNTSEDKKQPTGIMVNSEGDWVIAEPDQAAWDRYQAQAKTSVAAQTAAACGDRELQDRGLECKIDKRLFVDPTKTPCCGTTYCHECIQNALLDNDLRCPQCSTDNVPIDDLIPDEEMAARVRNHEQRKTSPNPETTTTPGENHVPPDNSDNSERPVTLSPPRSSVATLPSPSAQSESIGSKSRKRPAHSEIDNNRRPEQPKSRSTTTKVAKAMEQDPKQDSTFQPSIPPASHSTELSPFNPMNMANFNNLMGVGMPFSMAMQNTMQMPTAPPLVASGWNSGWGLGQNPYIVPMGPSGFAQFNTYTGQHQMAGTTANTRFSNQQQSNNEEESAYIRKPVNPNRQNNRRNWNQNRPADYREI